MRVSAPSVAAVQCAVEQIFPLVQPFRSQRTAEQIEKMAAKAELKRLKAMGKYRPKIVKKISDSDDEEEEESEESEEEMEDGGNA